MRLRLDPQAIRKYNQKQTSGRSSVVEQTLPKLPLANSKLLERRHLSTTKHRLIGK